MALLLSAANVFGIGKTRTWHLTIANGKCTRHLYSKTKFLCKNKTDTHSSPKDNASLHNNRLLFKGFSNLSPDFQCDSTGIWTSFSVYFFLLHIPLGLGGLKIVSDIIHQPDLSPQTKAISLVVTQMLELIGAIALIKSTYGAFDPLRTLKFEKSNAWKGRGWLKGSIIGICVIVTVVFLTSVFSESNGAEDTKNVIAREILSNTSASQFSYLLVAGIITPMLEEYVYRGFLLTSLVTCMEWPLAVFLSSLVFSAVHFSAANFLPLFFIGCILGCTYTWTGNLTSPLLVHSFYNIWLLIAILSK